MFLYGHMMKAVVRDCLVSQNLLLHSFMLCLTLVKSDIRDAYGTTVLRTRYVLVLN